HGTHFETEARLALLSLHERSRDWPAAMAVALALEQAGSGSFAQRIAHYHCEIALEADADGRADAAAQALAAAQRAAPDAPRPLMLAGERAARAGDAAGALAAWDRVRLRDPALFALTAPAYAQAAIDAHRLDAARVALQAVYAADPRAELLTALEALDTATGSTPGATARRLDHLGRRGDLDAAARVLELDPAQWRPDTRPQLYAAVQRTALRLQRYRCAACGFEAQHHFWQCPGCQGWDTFPPRRQEST
ncbi:MAG: lipopolysaccharide assembly protein LapB, partial [Rubrivivax sp.]